MRFVLGRLALLPPTLLLLALVTFFLGYLSPSDPIEIMLGQHASPEAAARLRREYGLDRPPLVQFGTFLAGALRTPQRAEFVLEKGFVDRIVHRREMHDEIARLLDFFWRSTGGFAPPGRELPASLRSLPSTSNRAVAPPAESATRPND